LFDANFKREGIEGGFKGRLDQDFPPKTRIVFGELGGRKAVPNGGEEGNPAATKKKCRDNPQINKRKERRKRAIGNEVSDGNLTPSCVNKGKKQPRTYGGLTMEEKGDKSP